MVGAVCHYFCVAQEGRLKKLIFLRNRLRFTCVIFCSSDAQVDWLESELHAARFLVTSVRSDSSQDEWHSKLDAFKNGSVPIFITTDRWADCFGDTKVRLVFNYDLPQESLYLKRVKALEFGFMITFVEERSTLVNYQVDVEELPSDVINKRVVPPILQTLRDKMVSSA